MFADQQIEKQHGKLPRIAACKLAGGLLLLHPPGNNGVGGVRSRFIKERSYRRKCLADRNHQTMQFENFRIEDRAQEVARDLRQLRLHVASRIYFDRMGDIYAGLLDDGFEQAFLAAETRIERCLRTTDQPDDFVDGDVGVALLDEQRRCLAHDLLTARFAHAAAGTFLRNVPRRRWPTYSLGL